MRLLTLMLVLHAPSAFASDVGDSGVARVEALPTLGPDHSDGYRVGPGDTIQVQVVGEEDLSNTYTVERSGAFKMPYIDKVKVDGLTADEITSLLVERYTDGVLNHPQIAVSVQTHEAHKVVVSGQDVKNPGRYALTGPTTVLEILSMSGWVGRGGSSREVELSRPDGTSMTLDLSTLAANPATDVLLVGDDRLTVKQGHVVYVGGEVAKPGSVPFEPGLTVLQALSEVGGPNGTARLRGAYVLRGEERINVNLRRIQDGREADLSLEPGDQLFLRESAI
ncbi:MAG: polysaccharide export outer membrane protein [Myxococcota bacterium]